MQRAWSREGAAGGQTPVMGLVQFFGSSPALLVFRQAFLVFTIFLAAFPSPTTPEAGSFLLPSTQQARKTLGHQLMWHQEGFVPFGTRWVEQVYFCSFKLLSVFFFFKAKTISTLLAHLFLPGG